MQDKRQKRDFRENQQRRLEEEEATKREQEAINRAKLMHRDKNVLNKDLIDFAHPEDAAPVEQSQDGHVDEVAEPIVDRRAILREQKLKRKQRELQKQQEEERQKQMKEERMMHLEQHLK